MGAYYANATIQLPTGTILQWAGTIASVPNGWLFCNGQAISRTTYALLFATIGTIYGVGNGSTTFNLPDTREKYIAGAKQDTAGKPTAWGNNTAGSLTTGDGYCPIIDAGHSHGASMVNMASSGYDVYVWDGNYPSDSASADLYQESHTHTIQPTYQSFPFIIKT